MGQVTAMSNTMVVDTDVLIDFLRGSDKAVLFVEKLSSHIIFPSIVVAELYAGVKNNRELVILDAFISQFKVIPLTVNIARMGGIYKQEFNKSHGVGLADAMVAATATCEHAELKTLNVKHYPMFRDLKPAYKK